MMGLGNCKNTKAVRGWYDGQKSMLVRRWFGTCNLHAWMIYRDFFGYFFAESQDELRFWRAKILED